eukprot:4913541-Pyramimonas_sp.AAC.1
MTKFGKVHEAGGFCRCRRRYKYCYDYCILDIRGGAVTRFRALLRKALLTPAKTFCPVSLASLADERATYISPQRETDSYVANISSWRQRSTAHE